MLYDFLIFLFKVEEIQIVLKPESVYYLIIMVVEELVFNSLQFQNLQKLPKLFHKFRLNRKEKQYALLLFYY